MGDIQMNIVKRREKLIKEIKNKEYRDGFVSAHIDIGIPFQIRALREQRCWAQKELAGRAGVAQAWVAKIESPNYSGFSLKTLKKLASAFDVGLIVRFVPISDLVKWELELSSKSLMVLSFDQDSYFKEEYGIEHLTPEAERSPDKVISIWRNLREEKPSQVSEQTETPTSLNNLLRERDNAIAIG